MHIYTIATCFYLILFGQFLVSEGFGYTDWEQRKWRNTHASCGGNLQSPIKINSREAIPLQMPALETVRYHDLLPGPLELHNNGHSVSLKIPKLEPSESQFVPYIFGARLEDEFELEGLHFHWGERNNMGSEHVFNDVRFPLEMHVIHRNRKYENIFEALQYQDGLAVLAFFYQIHERRNKGLSQIIRMLPFVEDYDSRAEINRTFPLSLLLPSSDDMERFYTYKGSLTTPPCSETVTWIVFPNPLPVSNQQMNKFRSLQAGDRTSILVNNYRKLQRLGSRRVFVRTVVPKGKRFNHTVHYSKWDWLY